MTARINPPSFLIGGALIASAAQLTRRLIHEARADDAPRMPDSEPENIC